ncbi:hypothetical protein HMSSN036_60320 [Paenibacillus macerans]|nr:hypothetical protein HMSSN036_60320 [Paenibacillus macerans]
MTQHASLTEPLLQAAALEKRFPASGSFLGGAKGKRQVHAVNGVSLSLYGGETYGLVGESGSGKARPDESWRGLLRPAPDRRSTGTGI